MSDIRYIGYFLQKAHRASPSVGFFVESEPEKKNMKQLLYVEIESVFRRVMHKSFLPDLVADVLSFKIFAQWVLHSKGFSDVNIWQIRHRSLSSSIDFFGITFLEGAKLSRDRNGCWLKETNWSGKGFSKNKKNHCLNGFFGSFAVNGIRINYFRQYWIAKLTTIIRMYNNNYYMYLKPEIYQNV